MTNNQEQAQEPVRKKRTVATKKPKPSCKRCFVLLLITMVSLGYYIGDAVATWKAKKAIAELKTTQEETLAFKQKQLQATLDAAGYIIGEWKGIEDPEEKRRLMVYIIGEQLVRSLNDE